MAASIIRHHHSQTQSLGFLLEMTMATIINDHDLEGMPLRLLFVRFLMASFLYYKLDEQSPWSDYEYDYAARRLLNHWDEWDHHHKRHIEKGDLEAGSGFNIRHYPTIVQVSALQWAGLMPKPQVGHQDKI